MASQLQKYLTPGVASSCVDVLLYNTMGFEVLSAAGPYQYWQHQPIAPHVRCLGAMGQPSIAQLRAVPQGVSQLSNDNALWRLNTHSLSSTGSDMYLHLRVC